MRAAPTFKIISRQIRCKNPRVEMSEEVVLSCVSSSGGKGVKIAAWSPGKGAIQRTYSSETEGGGAALAMLGKTHIMCALKSIPFIYVWHVRKVKWETFCEF